MRVLYVGHYMPGCTTRMRGEYLQDLLRPSVFDVVDIDKPIGETFPLFRPIGWRFKTGPLIGRINRFFGECIKGKEAYDLVWIDKGVFIEPEILAGLKRPGNKLVHFTPDTAFFHNRSRFFNEALPLYDFCVTTKSYEMEEYRKRGVKNLLYCTQGYDPRLHKPYHQFSEKTGLAFVGKQEAWREEAVARLLEAKFDVKLAGADWKNFAWKKRNDKRLRFFGEGLFGEPYASLISGSLIGLGFLSKQFPELHTTRTFEIPACGTVLATEKNEELTNYFRDDEVLYFSGISDLIEKVRAALSDREALRRLSENGQRRVSAGGFDYPSILASLLNQMALAS